MTSSTLPRPPRDTGRESPQHPSTASRDAKAASDPADRIDDGSDRTGTPRKRHSLKQLVEDDFIRRASTEEYQEKVKSVYGGPQGACLALASLVSLHIPLGERLFRRRRFDLAGMQSILDVGSGAGQLAGHLIRYADPQAEITCTDLNARGRVSRAIAFVSSPPIWRAFRLLTRRSMASPVVTSSNTCRTPGRDWLSWVGYFAREAACSS